MRKLGVVTVAALGLVLATHVVGAAEKEEKPDATITLSTGSVAAGVGFSWGSGVLVYQGKKHPIKIEGLSVGDVGISKASAKGKVYHLKKLSDFAGTYTSASAGATVGGGGSATAMQNQNGVLITLVSTSQGLTFKLATEGVKLELKK